jgi:hypothetical protein
MSMILTQTGTNSGLAPNAFGTGLTLGTGATNRIMARGGVGGAGATYSIAANANDVIFCEWTTDADHVGWSNWAAGTYTVRINVTTANMSTVVRSVRLVRVNSAGTVQAQVGALTAQSTSIGSAGTLEFAVTGTAQTAASGDRLVAVVAFQNTNTMSAQSFGIGSDLAIDTPITQGAFNQNGIRWRADDGSETAATWRQALNATDKIGTTGRVVRLRTEIVNSSNTSGATGFTLQRTALGAAYLSTTAITSAGMTALANGYLAVVSGSSLLFYKKNGDTLTALTTPTDPGGTVTDLMWNADATYLAVGLYTGTTTNLAWYKRVGDTVTRIGVVGQDGSNGYCGWGTAAGVDYLLAPQLGPNTYFYKRSGDTLVGLTAPTSAGSESSGAAWTSTGSHATISSWNGSASVIAFYRRDGDALTKLSNAPSTPSSIAGHCWLGNTWLFVGGSNGFVYVYERSGDTLTLVHTTSTSYGATRSLAVDASTGILLVATNATPFHVFWKFDSTAKTLTKYDNPSTIPTQLGGSVSASGGHFAGTTNTGDLRYYKYGTTWGSVPAAGTANVPVRYYNSTNLTDAGTTTQQIGTGTFVAGRVYETAHANTVTFTAGSRTELEVALEFVAGQSAAGDNIQFRWVRADGAVFPTYTNTATMQVAAPTLSQSSFRWRNDDGAEGPQSFQIDNPAQYATSYALDGTTRYWSQTFTAPAYAVQVTRVLLRLNKSGSPTDNVVVELRSGGLTGSVLASATLAATSVTTTLTDYWLTFDTPVALASGATGYIVVRRSGTNDSTNRVAVNQTAASSYTGGVSHYSADGTTWTTNANDLRFTIEGTRADGGATWRQALDTPDTTAVDATVRLRSAITETGGIAGTTGLKLQYGPPPTVIAAYEGTPSHTIEVWGTSSGTSGQSAGLTVPRNSTFRVGSVALRTSRIGSPADALRVVLRDGVDGTVLGQSEDETAPGVGVTTTFVFMLPVEVLASATPLFIEVIRTGSRDTSNYWSLSSALTPGYADGDSWRKGTTDTYTTATADLRFSLFGAAAWVDVPTAGATAVAYSAASASTVEGAVVGLGGTGEFRAQSFKTPSVPISVSEVTVSLRKFGNPTDDFVVELRNALASDLPLASGTLAASALSTTAASHTITLNNVASLAANSTYFLVFLRSGTRSTANFYYVTLSNGSVVADSSNYVQTSETWSEESTNDFIGAISGTVDAAVVYANSTYLTDAAATTQQITAGVFAAGRIYESPHTTAVTFAGSDTTEVEAVLAFVGDDLAPADEVYFRWVGTDGTELPTYAQYPTTVIAASQDRSGTTNISGKGALAAGGRKDGSGQAGLTGKGALASTAAKSAAGVAALSGGGTSTATGEVSTAEAKSGTVLLSGAGAVASLGTKGAEGAVSGTGAGALAVAAQRTSAGAVSLSGVGALASSGAKSGTGTTTLSGRGAAVAAGQHQASGALLLSGAGAASVTSLRGARGTFPLSGAGAVSATGQRASYGAGTVVGNGAFTASVRKTGAGTLVGTGGGTATTVGYRGATVSVSLSGAGASSTVGTKAARGAATLSGAGTANATASIIPTLTGAVTLSGGGTVVPLGEKHSESSVATSGSGTPVAQGTRAAAGATFGTGRGALTATGMRHGTADTVLSGGGSLDVDGYPQFTTPQAPLTGGGAMVGSGRKAAAGVVVLSGRGALAVTGAAQEQEQGTGVARLSAAGALTAGGTKAVERVILVSAAGTTATAGQKHSSDPVAISAGGTVLTTGIDSTPQAGGGIVGISGAGTVAVAAQKRTSGSISVSGAGAAVSRGVKTGLGVVGSSAGGASTAAGTKGALTATVVRADGALMSVGAKHTSVEAVVSGAGALTVQSRPRPGVGVVNGVRSSQAPITAARTSNPPTAGLRSSSPPTSGGRDSTLK